MKTLRFLVCVAAGALLSALSANATPYASGLTNNGNGTMSFYLNEAGGNVTITYEDSTIDPNFNGTTSGTNLPTGIQTFSITGHTSYTISVFKVGSGAPNLITSSFGFTPRGVVVNKRPASPYFGRVYADQSAGNIFVMNSDFSLVYAASRSAGVAWAGGGLSPYRLSITPDDFLMVGDASSANAGVYRIDPDVSTNQLVLGPIGETKALAAGSFGTIQSRPVVQGDPSTGSFTLLQVDGDLGGPNGLNSIEVYSNLSLATLPYTNAPTDDGAEVGLNLSSETLGDNEYPGLSQGTNGLIYASTYRNNLSNPLLQIYDATGTIQLWNSYYNGGASDYFLTTGGNGSTLGIVESDVSPDGRYVVGLSIDNWLVICPLTNGFPDTANLFISTPTSYTGNGRGVAFDAADNLYLSSSGIGLVQSWSLGLTTTAVTSGNASGSTDFSLALPSTTVSVTAVTNVASQGGSDGTVGTPLPGSFLITRASGSDDFSFPVTVNFSLTGTAGVGVYTVLPASVTVAGSADSITLPAGVVSTNITIIPTTNNVPRLTTTVILTVKGGSSYSTTQPVAGTVSIINTSTNQLVLSAGAPTMYKAFASDYASVLLTRLGDTNASYTVPASAFTYAGTAVPNTDFVPMPAVTFNPGDVTHAPEISPLVNGNPPVDTANPVYTGNKSVTVGLTASPAVGYESTVNTTALTLLDNAYPPSGVLLFSDPLTDPADAAHWNITYGTADEVLYPANYDVEFGYDLTAANGESGTFGLIGYPPSGASNALRITCDKASNPGAEGGVNVYYTNQLFSGNYAVRFYMNLIQGSGTFDAEGCLFGLNHNGIESNWWEESGPVVTPAEGPWASDGIWYWIDADPTGGAFVPAGDDFTEFTGATALPNTGWVMEATVAGTTEAAVFKTNVFTTTGGAGAPANDSPFSRNPSDNNWSDVEMRQVNGVVTMSIDHTPIFVFTNTTTFTNGYIMLGYNCPVGGTSGQYIGASEAGVYYSDLNVVELGPDITAQPVGLTVGAGSNATFSVTSAFATSSVTNQLYTAAGAAIGSPVIVAGPGGPATVTFIGVTPASDGNYTVVVSDSSGSATSSVVALTVIAPPFVTNEPVSVTNNVGATVTFTVTNGVAGTSPFTYQWYSNTTALANGGQVSGATAATLTIASINVSDDASYKVVVTNFAGSATSTAATLTAIVPPRPDITGVSLVGNTTVLQFTTGDQYDTTNSFNLQNSTNLDLPVDDGFTTVAGTTLSYTLNAGVFTVTVTNNSAAGSFYRLQHK